MHLRRSSLLCCLILFGVAHSWVSCTTSKLQESEKLNTFHELLAQLEQLVEHSTKELKKLEEVSQLTQKEIAKYRKALPAHERLNLLRNVDNTGTLDHKEANRFTQLQTKEPVDSSVIRNALYATQPVSDPPQSSIIVDSLEDVNDVVRNASTVASFSEDGTRDFFEEELHQMKLEAESLSQLKSIRKDSNLLNDEIRYYMTHKPEPTKPRFVKQSKRGICYQWTVDVKNRYTMEHNLEDAYKQCKDAACRDDEETPIGLKGGKASPPTRKELGRAGWLYLHSMAADFPEQPTELETLSAKAWCYSFAALYPCHICREGLLELYKKAPPLTNTRRNFLMWTFDIHNKVNAELSYPAYNSTYDELMDKYKQA